MKKSLSAEEWERACGDCVTPWGEPLPDGTLSNSHIDGNVRMVKDGKWIKLSIPQSDGTLKPATTNDLEKLIFKENVEKLLKKGRITEEEFKAVMQKRYGE